MKDKEEIFRPIEPVRKATVWVPFGAKENLTALPADPPFTEYDDMAKEFQEKMKKKQAEEKGS